MTKNTISILKRIANKKHYRELKRKEKRKKLKIIKLKRKRFFAGLNIDKFKLLSDNLQYVSDCKKTDLLNIDFDQLNSVAALKKIPVPEKFSLVDTPKESYKFINDVINTIYHNRTKIILLDYKYCNEIHLGAQVFFDILLRDILKYQKKIISIPSFQNYLEDVRPVNMSDDIKKLLYSIGSFAVIKNLTYNFPDIEPYPLCEFKKNDNAADVLFNIEKKEEHTTELVKYVIKSLGRMNKELNSDSKEYLGTIIGEILINAEEHSTNNHRFSIGYFKEVPSNDSQDKYGIFNLVILNFGRTIYDTFKDPECDRKDILERMEALSEKYRMQSYFGNNLNEEVLWTLYALQEEVTSVPTTRNLKRGNGSIKFIESFFGLKSDGNNLDNVSRLAILSGNASIVFDGKYKIEEKTIEGEDFKVMTFNDSGDISKKPDANYVKFAKNHFPGTLISAQILINKDDIKK